jgi:outer membrane receptor protein involved in Fe transport
MRFLRCLWLLVIALAGAEAAEAAEGRVIDKKTGAPIANATVLVVGSTTVVKTDADGRFSIKPDPQTPFEVVIVTAAERMSKPLRVERLDASATLLIEVESFVDEEITVTGAAPSIDSPPGAAMTLLSGADVAARTPANLMQALENVAGVNQVSEGQAAVPAIRGLAQGRTLILIDGARVSAERRVGPSATFLDPAVIGGVDVARGPGSVAYGSDAFGGVISIRTKRVSPGSPLSVKASATLGAGIPERRAALEVGRGFAKGSLFAAAHVRSVDDYNGPSGPVLNSGYRDSGALIRADRITGNGLLSFGWQSDFARDVERPRNNSNVTRFFYPFENSHRFTAEYETADLRGFSEFRVTAFFGRSGQRTDQDTFATATRARSLVRADIYANDFGLRAVAEKNTDKVRFETGVDLNGRFGLEAHDILIAYDLTGAETSASDTLSTENARKADTGVFAQVRGAVTPKLEAALGLRADIVKNTNTGGYFGNRSDTNTSASGFGSFTFGPFDGLSVTAQASRGSRDPRLSDLYYRGPTGRGFITGNPDLDTENSLQFDFGAHYSAKAVRAGVYAYRYEIRNLIERYQTQTDFFFFRNRGTARLRGLEAELQATLGRGFSLEMAAQAMSGRAVDDGAGLDDLSPGSISAVVRRELGRHGSSFVRVAAFAKMDTPGPNETEAPGYTMIDAGASWRLHKALELRVSGRNLLNTEYHASPVSRWVFGPGRSFSLTAVAGF